MKIINPGKSEYYHIHSFTYSDGLNSIDELVIQAGQIGLNEIAITDQNKKYMTAYGISQLTHYDITVKRKEQFR